MVTIGLEPESMAWESISLSSLYNVKYGRANPGRTGIIPVVGSSGIYAWTDTPLIQHPTIVIGRKGSAGQAWLLEMPSHPSDTTFYLEPLDSTHSDIKFIYYALRHFQLAATEDVIPSLQRHELENLTLPLPPLHEQRGITAVLSKIQAAVAVQEKIVATLRELKAATMAKLFREGLRREPLKQTEIGEVPESWNVVLLGELCKEPEGFIQTGPFGSQLHASDYVVGGVPIVNPTHLNSDRIQHANIPTVSVSDADRLKRHKLNVGDILFSRRGDVGRHAHVFEGEEGWLCGTGCLIVRPCRTKVYPLYLSYYLSTSVAQEYLKSHAVGSIMPNINTKVLSAVCVAVPRHEDQLKVAELLHSLDRKIQHADVRLAILKPLFSSMLQLLITGQVRVNHLNIDTTHADGGQAGQLG